MINFLKKVLIGNIEWCLYLNIFIIKRKAITESLVLIFINSLKTFHNRNEGIMCIFLSNENTYPFSSFIKFMILVHSSECDEGWVTYGGHDYMMNTTRVSQPEAMVRLKLTWSI